MSEKYHHFCVAFHVVLIKASCFGQIGPDVSISANVRIGSGVRLINCIILDDVKIEVCSFLILGMKRISFPQYEDCELSFLPFREMQLL